MTPPSPSPRPSRRTHDSLPWIWSAVILSFLVCIMVTWLHVQQKRELRTALKSFETIRQARIDLTKGFLHLSLASAPGSPFGRAQGLVLLRQAISSFDNSLALAGRPNKSVADDFHKSVDDFEGHLAQWEKTRGSATAKTVALRISFYRLERQADRLDDEIQRSLSRRSETLDFHFDLALGGAILFLAVICCGVFAANRAKEKYAEASWENEDRLRLLGDNLPDSYVYQYLHEADGSSRFVYLSAGVENVHGVCRETILLDANALLGQIAPEQIERLAEAEATSLQEMTDFQMELHICRADGEWRWLQVRSRPRHNGEGQVVWDGVTTDITARKRTEAALRESEKKHQQTLDTMLEGCQIIGFDWRYLYLNDAIEKQSRRPRAELIGRTMMECWPGINEAPLFAMAKRCMEERATHQLENEFRFPDGSSGWFRLNIQPAPEGIVIFSEDITDRMRMENVFRESRDQLQRFVGQAPAALAMFDTEMRYLCVSQRWKQDYGLGERDLIGESHYEIFPEIGEEWRETHRRGLAGEVLRADADRFERADGTIQWVRWESHPWYDAAGNIGGIVIFTEDITGVKNAEEALAESESAFRAIFDQAAVGMAQVALDGRLLRVNQKLCDIVGYPREELIARTFQDITYAEDLEANLEFIRHLMAGQGTNYSVEKRYLRKDQSVVWAALSAVLVRGASGTPAYFVSVVEDITARKSAEERALRWQRVFEASDFGLAHANIADNSFLEVNESFARQRGYSPQELRGLPILEIFAPSEREAMAQRFKEINESDHLVFETAHQRRDGSVFPVLLEVTCVRDKKGTLLSRVAHAIDITERKQAVEAIRRLNDELEERVRERTAQLEAVNKELETFSYSVSHDLKAPLRGIDGYSQLLETECADRLDDEGRLFISNIRASAAQMHQLIDDLLSYSRIERRSLQHVTLDLSALVEAVAAERTTDIEQSGVRLLLDVPPVTAYADREGLAVVLRNLLENALKFSRGGRPPTVEIGARAENAKAVLWVRDNGIGFDMKFHERIFEIFQRLQRVEDYPGTGIGLALVRKAIQRMDGRVWAESSPGQGATFFLEIPR